MAVNFGPGLHAAIGRRVDHSAYDRYLGRWSRLFVPAVLAAADVTAGHRILDVATGPGEAASMALPEVGPAGLVVGPISRWRCLTQRIPGLPVRGFYQLRRAATLSHSPTGPSTP